MADFWNRNGELGIYALGSTRRMAMADELKKAVEALDAPAPAGASPEDRSHPDAKKKPPIVKSGEQKAGRPEAQERTTAKPSPLPVE
jgi:hypothetical protein